MNHALSIRWSILSGPGLSGLFLTGLYLSGLCLASFVSLPAHAASLVLRPGDDVRSLTQSLQAGDVIEFNDGVYDIPYQLEWVGVGTADRPIVFKAVDGAKPVLELSATGGGHIALIHDSEHLVIQGLTFSGNAAYADQGYGGIQLYTNKNITIRDCEIRQVASSALYMPYTNTDVLIEHNQIHDTVSGHGIYVGTWNGSEWATGCNFKNNWIYNINGSGTYGIVIARGSYANSVVDNNIHTVEYRGIGLAQYTSTDPDPQPNLVERNAVWSIGNIGIEAHGSSVVRNNLIFNVNGYGLYSSPADDDTASELIFANNTIEGTSSWGVYFRQRVGVYVLANNVICNPLGYAFNEDDIDEADVANVLIADNVACGLVEAFDPLDGGFLTGAGLDDFRDAETFDYWPGEGSHLIDAGTADALYSPPADDFNAQPRTGGVPDIGAYEWSREANPGWIISEGFKSLEVASENQDTVTTEAGCGGCSSTGSRRQIPADALLLGGLVVWLGRRRR